jgi:hypothetical protein
MLPDLEVDLDLSLSGVNRRAVPDIERPFSMPRVSRRAIPTVISCSSVVPAS